MKKLLLFCFFAFVLFLPGFVFAQADDCATPATTVTLSTSVCTPLSGNTLSASASSGVPACVGSPDDDVWYQFTTPAGAANYAFVYVDASSSSFDPVFQVLSGACGAQASVACVDAGGAGVNESVSFTGVTSSTTYYFRVYGYPSGSGGDGSFTVCAFNGAKPANDECASAVTLTPGSTCTPTAGTTAWATNSGVADCAGGGSADDDVWYKFVANATYERIVVDPTGGSGADLEFDPVVQVFSACGGGSLACSNAVGAGGTEDFFVSGLTGGSTYYVRVYHYGSFYANRTDGGTFNICVMGGSPPANNDCAGALALPTNSSCVIFGGSSTTTFATQSSTGTPCTGYSIDDDVWYSFTAINYTHTLTVDPNTAMNVQIQILSGACGSLLSEQCQDNIGLDGTETMAVSGLTIGNTYYVRISHNGAFYGSDGSFTICNVASAPVGGDDLCNAISLPTVTSACIYGTYDNSSMPTGSSALPAGCSERANGARRHMWFKFVVPSGGKVSINVKGLTGNITNPTVAAFSWNGGACGTLTNFTLLSCNNDFCNVNGDCNYHSVLNLSGLTVGATIFFKVSSASTDNGAGTFKICVSAPINDNCPSPLFVCDLNGFEGTTSAGYTIDNSGLQNWSGGPFGSGGGTTIENNSWLQFEASATSANITITVSDCYLDDGGAGEYQYNCCGGPGGFNGGGLQMEILSMNGGNCSSPSGWTSVSSFLEDGNGSYSVSATGLSVGQNYYVLFDGFAGDVCNYKINAATGVGTTTIVTPASSTTSICSGNTATLSINPVGSGATINWSSTPTGYTCNNCPSSVTVDPAASPGVSDGTVTYLATVTGNCITPQTVSANVVVEPTPPAPSILTDPVAFCGVTSITATATAANANDFEWFDAASGGNSLHSGQGFTPSVSDNQIGSYTFYVSGYNTTGNPTCTSATRGTLTVPINTWDGKIKWTGNAAAATPNWTNTLNWEGCTAGCSDTAVGVIIPDQALVPGPNKYPVISSGVAAKDLQLDANSRLDFSTNGVLNICGSFAHYGSLTVSAGSPAIYFYGTTKQTYVKTSTGSGDLPNVVISNAAGVAIADGAGYQDMTLNSSSTLTLTNGILSNKNTREVYIKNSNTNAVTGFGTTSYINGRLRRAVAVSATPYDFPVGNANAYELMKISISSVTGLSNLLGYFENLSNNDGAGWGSLSDAGTNFITTASPTIPVNIGGANATTGHSYAGVWTVVPNAGSADYGMTLYGRNYSNSGGATHTIVKRSQYTCSSPNWGLAGTYASSSVAGNVVTVERTGMSGFSQFSIGRHSTPLPIDLLFFNAVCNNGNEVKITFLTATEVNNDFFTIERSIDGIGYEPIKIIDASGNSSTIKQYLFTDDGFPGGTCYYRLKQTDIDGSYEYFAPVTASCGQSDGFTVISIVPNPAKDNLFIFFNSDNTSEPVTILITDMLGKTVVNAKVIPSEGLNQQQIDMSNYSNGIYYVNVSNGTKNHIEKIVKQY